MREFTFTFEPRRKYRCHMPDGTHIDYSVQRRTSSRLYLHDSKGKQFCRRVLMLQGVEFCYPFPRRFLTESSPFLLASNVVERKVA
jgi:hypothetical protein